MNTAEYIVIGAMLLVIIVQTVSFHLDRKALRRDNDTLMDRLMAPDYQAYLVSQRLAQQAPRRSLREFVTGDKKEEEESKKEDDLGMPVT